MEMLQKHCATSAHSAEVDQAEVIKDVEASVSCEPANCFIGSSFRQAKTLYEVLDLADQYARRMAHEHYLYCGAIDMCAVNSGRFSVARAPWPLLQLSGYERSSCLPANNLQNLFLGLVSGSHFVPEYWDIKYVESRGLPELAKILTECGITSGVTFVIRGLNEDVGCLTLMNRIDEGAQRGPMHFPFFAMRADDMGAMSSEQHMTGNTGQLPSKNLVCISMSQKCVRCTKQSEGLFRVFSHPKEKQPDEQVYIKQSIKPLSFMELFLVANILLRFSMQSARYLLDQAVVKSDNRINRQLLLSSREFEVSRHLVAGSLSKVIASDLGCSISNVNYHIGNIFKKLNVKTRAAAVSRLRSMGVFKINSVLR